MNKRGAFELSITTMIVIVLAITMLIMGLVLIRNIFGRATESIDKLSTKVSNEIDKIFTDDSRKTVVYLGEDRTARIRAGTANFGIAIGAQTVYNTPVNTRADVQYKMELDEGARDNCLVRIGPVATKNLFVQKIGEWNDMEIYQGANAKTILQVSIPEATPLCTQKVFLSFIDKSADTEGLPIGGDFFIIEVLGKGLF